MRSVKLSVVTVSITLLYIFMLVLVTLDSFEGHRRAEKENVVSLSF